MSSLPTSAEAVVFDCDGLLVNTEVCWTVAETAIFAAHGHSFGPEQKALVIGRTVEAAGRPWRTTSAGLEPANSPPNSSKESAKSWTGAPPPSPGQRSWYAPVGQPCP